MKGFIIMTRRSKLEMQIDILKVLARYGPLKLTHIMYKANINCSVLKQYLDFLIRQNLVEEQTVGKRKVVYVAYAITGRGRIILKHVRDLYSALPVFEEGRNIPPLLY